MKRLMKKLMAGAMAGIMAFSLIPSAFALNPIMNTPDEGAFSVGETVRLSYVDQQHKDIDP